MGGQGRGRQGQDACAIEWWGVPCVVREKKDNEGDDKTGKWMERKRKKTTNPAKRWVGKKLKNFLRDGTRGNRPLTPTKKALTDYLRANSTPGKALDDKPSTTYALI